MLINLTWSFKLILYISSSVFLKAWFSFLKGSFTMYLAPNFFLCSVETVRYGWADNMRFDSSFNCFLETTDLKPLLRAFEYGLYISLLSNISLWLSCFNPAADLWLLFLVIRLRPLVFGADAIIKLLSISSVWSLAVGLSIDLYKFLNLLTFFYLC